MNILYLHGFQSSSNSSNVEYLKQQLTKSKHVFYCLDLPHQPKSAIDFIETKIKELKIDIIIGTSLGGVYAYNFEIPKICINPAFQFELKEGKYQYFNKRDNNETEFIFSNDDISYIKKLIKSYKNKNVIDPLFYTSYILIGTDDTYVSFDKIKNYTNKFDTIIYAKFEHRLTENIIETYVLNLIQKLSDSIDSINNMGIHE